MFDRLGRGVVAHRRLVLVAALLITVACGAIGYRVFDVIGLGGLDDPASESSRAEQLINDRFGGETEMVFLVTARDGNVESRATKDAAAGLVDRMRQDPRLSFPQSYWETNVPQTRSLDQTSGVITARVAERTLDMVKSVAADYRGPQAGGAVDVRIGGAAMVEMQAQEQTEHDLLISESFAVPVIAVLLFLVFGSLVSSLLPVFTALLAIIATLAVLTGIGSISNLAAYAISLTTALGLGLAIDYGLLMVSRYREELAGGKPIPVAVADAVRTAGRTITFSALTVAVALAALALFPMSFVRSFAYTGITVATLSWASSVLVLPALLAVLGPRVEWGRLPRMKQKPSSAVSPFWARTAARGYDRPLRSALPVLILLLVAAVPLTALQLGSPDERQLPSELESSEVGQVLRVGYDGTTRQTILLSGPLEDRSTAALTDYARRLARVPGVTGVSTPAGNFTAELGPLTFPVQSDLRTPGTDMVTVLSDTEPRAKQSEDMVRELRATPTPPGTSILVTGDSAVQLDTNASIVDHLPQVLGAIVLTTFVLLFLFTGSVLQPVRSLLFNAVGLSAIMGLVVLIFQDGLGAGLLGFTPTPLQSSALVLLFVLAFGLSMDYEVFVISRIKEARDRGAGLRDTVVDGLSRTGGIITAAALLLSVSMMSLVASGVSFMKMIGLGIAVSILMDSSLIRGVLLPASMRLMGRWAWWSPRWLVAVHNRIGLSESGPGSEPEPPPRPPAEPEPAGAGRHHAGSNGSARGTDRVTEPVSRTGAPR